MGEVHLPRPVKLFAGLLGGEEVVLQQAREALRVEFGPEDLVSPVWPFTATQYYHDEMGDPILRQFVFFEQLIVPERIADIKLRTNEIEAAICQELSRPRDRRPVNIDPGYMSLGKLVLVTTKDYTHRLYLGRGIYAEVTLYYHARAWQAWPWTYADYAAETYRPFLCQARQVLKAQLSPLS